MKNRPMVCGRTTLTGAKPPVTDFCQLPTENPQDTTPGGFLLSGSADTSTKSSVQGSEVSWPASRRRTLAADGRDPVVSRLSLRSSSLCRGSADAPGLSGVALVVASPHDGDRVEWSPAENTTTTFR